MSKISRVLEGSYTVRQLIEELESYPDDAKVVIVSGYGDRGNTQQVLNIESVEELADDERVCTTPYSNSGLAVEDADYDDDGNSNRGDDQPDDLVLIRV